MKKHSQIQHFQQTLNRKDCRENIIKISQPLIDKRFLIDRVLHRQCYTAKQDHKHDKSIEKWASNKPVKTYSNTEIEKNEINKYRVGKFENLTG